MSNTNSFNIHAVMMKSTIKIVGPSKKVPGQGTVGTGFVIGKPFPNDPTKGTFVLVTADHVLSGIDGDFASLVRPVANTTTQWLRSEGQIRIRDGAVSLWKKHPKADLAATVISLPTSPSPEVLSADLLMNDDKVQSWDIGPGTELLCLGYPEGVEANAFGFPILRAGRIASYPLIPSKTLPTFLFDFSVFGGNSGGPVYIHQRNPIIHGNPHLGGEIYGIMGLVTEQGFFTKTIVGDNEVIQRNIPLHLGVVINASLIKELIDSM